MTADEEKRIEASRALGYVELYGAYAECEAIYSVDRLLALWDGLDTSDQESFCFDPRVVEAFDEVATDLRTIHARLQDLPGPESPLPHAESRQASQV